MGQIIWQIFQVSLCYFQVRNLFSTLRLSEPRGDGMDPCVLDVMDMSCPRVIEKVLPHLPPADRVRKGRRG